MAKTQFLTFNIVLTDEALVKQLQEQYPTGVMRAPYNAAAGGGAAVEFGAPWHGAADPGAGQAPYSWSPFAVGVGPHVNRPYPIDVATFTRHSGGFLGIGGTTVKFVWIGKFIYAAGNGASPPTIDAPELEDAPLAKTRFVEGFEIPLNGPSTAASGNSFAHSRDAARHTGGMGLAFRGCSNIFSVVPLNSWTPGLVDAGSWERFYVRLRHLPAASVSFYRANGFPSGQGGATLAVNPTGNIECFNIDSGGVKTLLGATSFALPVWTGLASHDAWVRLDLLVYYNPNGASPSAGALVLYLNGMRASSFTATDAVGGLGQSGSRHATSSIGNGFVLVNALELDIDGWVNKAIPPGRLWDGVVTPPLTKTGYQNEYDPATDYVVGDLVFRSKEDHVYKCIKDHGPATLGAFPPSLRTGGTYWHRFEGLDWRNGSKVALVRPTEFGGANHNPAWGGAVQIPDQNAWGGGVNSAALSTTTPSAICEVDTDAVAVLDGDKQSIGVASLMVSCLAARGTSDGAVGYAIAGGAAVTRAEAGANGIEVPQMALLSPDGVSKTTTTVTPLRLRYVKGADAAAARVRSLMAQAELLGVFGMADWLPSPVPAVWESAIPYEVGDYVVDAGTLYKALVGNTGVPPVLGATWGPATPPDFPHTVGQHNAPYPRSPWGMDAMAAPPAAAVIFHAGTYVGNSTGQDLTFRLPIHLFFVRPLVAGTGGFHWTSAGAASHEIFRQALNPQIAEGQADPTFLAVDGDNAQQVRYRIRIGGAHAQLNQTGVTYQYLAIEDPGERFILNTTFGHNALMATAGNPLVDVTFLPDFTLLQGESYDQTNTLAFYGKGPQNAPGTLCKFDGVVLNSAIALAAGNPTTLLALHALGYASNALSLFRKADGNNDPNQSSVMATGGYVGDGSVSRTITMPTTGGKRPLFALFFAEGHAGAWRDPSHTTNTSSDHGGTIVTDAITGGAPDSVLVGIALNAVGVNYNYLVFWAGTGACNGGWGCNGEYIPVEATSSASGPWPGDPLEGDLVETPPAGGPVGSSNVEEPDFDGLIALPGTLLHCIDFTTRLVNVALTRLGVTVQITDLVNDLTVEAAVARLIVKGEVEATLRDFPWPFATLYGELELVDGTELVAANNDWQYAYRTPWDCVYARRIARAGNRRAFERDPIEFRRGYQDWSTGGGLVFCNEPALTLTTPPVPLVLEYTRRMSCPAYHGDAQFRNALMWRFAHAIAAGLSRDAKRQALCWAMYKDALRTADTATANETQLEQPDDHDPDWISGR